MAYQLSDFADLEISVAMTAKNDEILGEHVHKDDQQEDLAFAYWKPSVGARRFTAVIGKLIPSGSGGPRPSRERSILPAVPAPSARRRS